MTFQLESGAPCVRTIFCTRAAATDRCIIADACVVRSATRLVRWNCANEARRRLCEQRRNRKLRKISGSGVFVPLPPRAKELAVGTAK